MVIQAENSRNIVDYISDEDLRRLRLSLVEAAQEVNAIERFLYNKLVVNGNYVDIASAFEGKMALDYYKSLCQKMKGKKITDSTYPDGVVLFGSKIFVRNDLVTKIFKLQ